MQPVLSPEEALNDPELLADGCVALVDDPEHGRIREVGSTLRISGTEPPPPRRAPAVGEHTDEVRGEARSGPGHAGPDDVGVSVPRSQGTGAALDGVRVLDLGLAVAGPFGTQVLSDLGADVVKVNTLYDMFWHTNHIAMACNRGKRSIAVDLKQPRGMEVLRRLVAECDVVHHNMRYDAAVRLGVDDASLRAVNPALDLLPHAAGSIAGAATGSRATTRPRRRSPASPGRTAGAPTGAGRCGASRRSATSGTASCRRSACSGRCITATGPARGASSTRRSCTRACSTRRTHGPPRTARRHRVRTSTGSSSASPRSTGCTRPVDGWLCIAAVTDDHWRRLVKAVDRDDLGTDERFATAAGRAEHDRDLRTELTATLQGRGASEWFDALDSAGVPCEVESDTFALGVFDDPELIERGWVTQYEQGLVGRLHQAGMLVDLSDTPGRVAGPPLVVGDSSRAILSSAGYADGDIDALIADGIVLDSASGS